MALAPPTFFVFNSPRRIRYPPLSAALRGVSRVVLPRAISVLDPILLVALIHVFVLLEPTPVLDTYCRLNMVSISHTHRGLYYNQATTRLVYRLGTHVHHPLSSLTILRMTQLLYRSITTGSAITMKARVGGAAEEDR